MGQAIAMGRVFAFVNLVGSSFSFWGGQKKRGVGSFGKTSSSPTLPCLSCIYTLIDTPTHYSVGMRSSNTLLHQKQKRTRTRNKGKMTFSRFTTTNNNNNGSFGSMVAWLFLLMLWMTTTTTTIHAQSMLNETVSADPMLTALVSYVQVSGLDLNALPLPEGTTTVTLLAPTNTAFMDLQQVVVMSANPMLLDRILVDPSQWYRHAQCLVLTHVLAGRVASTDLTQGRILQPISTEEFNITVTTTTPMVTLNDLSPVLQADIAAGTDLMHTIGYPLVPRCISQNIIESASSTQFGIFLRLLDLTGLSNLLMSPGPFTVFAPPDEVFTTLNINLAVLEAPENRQGLTLLLSQHVVSSGMVFLDPTRDGQEINLRTLAGFSLLAERNGTSSYEVTDYTSIVNIQDENNIQSNGVVHVCVYIHDIVVVVLICVCACVSLLFVLVSVRAVFLHVSSCCCCCCCAFAIQNQHGLCASVSAGISGFCSPALFNVSKVLGSGQHSGTPHKRLWVDYFGPTQCRL